MDDEELNQVTRRMTSNNGITYESMLIYLQQAEKEMMSTLDVLQMRPCHAFDSNDNLCTLNDLQIYCDTLLMHLAQELTQFNTNDDEEQEEEQVNHHHNNNNDNNNFLSDNEIDVGSAGAESRSRSGSVSLSSPLLLTNSVTESPISLLTASVASASSTSSSNHSINDSVPHFTNNQIQNYLTHNRFSFYENNDEVAAELLTASQIHSIV